MAGDPQPAGGCTHQQRSDAVDWRRGGQRFRQRIQKWWLPICHQRPDSKAPGLLRQECLSWVYGDPVCQYLHRPGQQGCNGARRPLPEGLHHFAWCSHQLCRSITDISRLWGPPRHLDHSRRPYRSAAGKTQDLPSPDPDSGKPQGSCSHLCSGTRDQASTGSGQEPFINAGQCITV